MKNKHYINLAISSLLIIVCAFQAIEEPEFISRLKTSLRTYNQNLTEEKVYVQLDKPFYKPGEDIWFNAFVVNSNSNRPTHISDVLYVELIDPKGNVATKLDLVIREGTAYGDFMISDSAPGGLYQIRAYTQWMKNFGKESRFKKEVQVQRIITPRLLLKLDFEKEAYGAGEPVSAKLTISNLKNQKVENALIDLTIKIDGVTKLTKQIKSNNDGIATLYFQLPDTLTNTDGVLQAVVNTADVQESISRAIPIVLNKISVKFLPEGGNWMQHANCRIAFKALNEFGKGADVAGVILDEHQNVVTSFKSFHMGMGAFELNAAGNKKYYARIDSPPGNQTLIPLPEVATTGLVLNLINRDDKNLYWNLYAAAETEVYLVAQTNGEIHFGEYFKLKAGVNSITVATTNFPAGITVFTVFDREQIEQCERLVFVNRQKGLHIKLTPDKSRYLPREQVNLDILTTDGNGKPMPSKLSVSVVDDKLISFADDKQDNILSALLLSSELKGEIQEPAFYFDAAEPKAIAALDYLMMTQGWRRFSWKEVIANNKPIVFAAEKNKNISGVLTNDAGAGIAGEVTLLELGGKNRAIQVKTTREGHFLFTNTDPSIPLLLLTKKPGKISLRKESTFSISLNDKERTVLLPDNPQQTTALAIKRMEVSEETDSDLNMDMGMTADVTQLSEVVVTGYGVIERRDMAGSVVTIQSDNLNERLNASSIESALQGRVAGLMITPQSGNPGAQANLIIRGFSSLAGGRHEPLYVIDGHPIGTSLNQNFSNGSMIGPNEILSIQVINSPEASALYGSAAANGVIAITTRNHLGYYNPVRKNKLNYNSHTITPRKFSRTRQFYVPAISTDIEERTDFRSTIYWNHTVVTDARGKASVTFNNNDDVSAFRITAEGFTGDGLIGRAEEVYYTTLPLALDVKLPEFLGYEDVLKLPVRIKNETINPVEAIVILDLPHGLRVKESTLQNITISAASTQTVWFTLSPTGVAGNFPISIKLKSKSYTDVINHTINVKPIGFPMQQSFSSKAQDQTFRFTLEDIEQHSLQATFTAYTDILDDLFTGVDAILREPYGCFEQVSSSNYPNILALQYLKQSGMPNNAAEKRAINYLQSGYKKLTAYEIKGGGFEWFGHPPAHEGLTAYGLIQFHEMQKVFDGVDTNMMNRTRNWLLSRKDGKGGFTQVSGKYGFSGASKEVTNAYITYALSETGTKELLSEYLNASTAATRSNDMYQLALVANIAFNLGRNNEYATLIKLFKGYILANGYEDLQAQHSIVWSSGHSLQTETYALWTLALLKAQAPDLGLINGCIRKLIAGRQHGQFGSTQATALSLQVLTQYATLVRRIQSDGDIQIYLNSTLADKLSYKKESREKLVLQNFVKETTSEQVLRIKFDNTTEPLPYSVDLKWYTKKPQSSDQCKVVLNTSLSTKTIRLNETVRLAVSLRNKTNTGLPMTVAVIGIPAGLSTQPWQLKELQEKGVFDFYEIMGGNLVLYYRELAPKGNQNINLDLKAEIPGSFVGGASSAYLYYTNEFKHWVGGNPIEIQ